MQVVVNKLLTNYLLSGKGQLVLLLHGYGDDSQGLQAIHTKLAKKYQVLACDLPGFGGTETPSGIWDLDNYAQFIRDLLNKLELKQPYAVIGHSNGGALAIRAVSLQLLQPKKLILIAASGVRSGKHTKRFVLKVLAKTGNAATLWMPERYRQALSKSLYSAAGSDMLVAPHLQETFKKVVRQDVQRDAKQITIPTLLIYAADDRAVPVRDGQRYQQLMGDTRLEVIPDAGHFVHLEQPEAVMQLIEEFLQ